jgi:YggT family protein
VNAFLSYYLYFVALLRVVLFVVGALLADVFAIDWLVRTRRIPPFGAVARFFRTVVDPLIAPVERAVVRAGGQPSSAPWWALVAVVVGGIALISVLQFLGQQLYWGMNAFTAGPRGIWVFLVSLTFGFLQLALFVRVASSWVRVSPYSRWVRWAYAVTEPILAPLRGFIPSMGGLDVTPIVAYFLLRILQSILI